MLDVSLRAQHEGLARLARAETGELLGGHGVQPGEPVGPRDGHDAAVREVDHREPLLEQTLLAQGVAVVGGHSRVGPVVLDCPVPPQQG